MSIHSTPFGPTILTGEDAEKFIRQVTHGRPNKAAIASLKRGKELLRLMDKNGHVKISIPRTDTGTDVDLVKDE